jgi:hypothetical protein
MGGWTLDFSSTSQSLRRNAVWAADARAHEKPMLLLLDTRYSPSGEFIVNLPCIININFVMA